MESVKYKIVWFWLTHGFLRRIAKRYPDYFKKWIYDLTDNENCRRVMLFRYYGEKPLKFEAIAITMNTDIRNVFFYHKKVVNSIITGD